MNLFPDVQGSCEGLWQAAEQPQDACGQQDATEQLCEAVRHAVAARLTSKQREVVEGYFFEGVSQGELARRLGVSQQVVHKRLYGVQRGGKQIGGALGKLRQVLQPLVQP